MKAILAAVIAVGGVAAGSWAGGVQAVGWLDSRYAPVSAVEDMQWAILKREIRELRDRVERRPNDAEARRDLQEVIDRFCRSYPDDRECQA